MTNKKYTKQEKKKMIEDEDRYFEEERESLWDVLFHAHREHNERLQDISNLPELEEGETRKQSPWWRIFG